MAYDPELADRLRAALAGQDGLTEKKMFGGIAYLIDGHMACGVNERRLMLRLGEAGAAAALGEAHVSPMDFTGRPIKTMVYVEPEGHATDAVLRRWALEAVSFARTLPPRKK